MYNSTRNIIEFVSKARCTQRSLFQILSYQSQIRLYLPCTDWFGTANGQRPFAVPKQSGHGKYNPISGWFHKIRKTFLLVPGAYLNCPRVSTIHGKILNSADTGQRGAMGWGAMRVLFFLYQTVRIKRKSLYSFNVKWFIFIHIKKNIYFFIKRYGTKWKIFSTIIFHSVLK